MLKVESALQMEKKWRGGGKTKSEYSSAEVIVPTEINTSLPRVSSPSSSSPTAEDGEEKEAKTEEYAQDADTLPEEVAYSEEGAGEMEGDGAGEMQGEQDGGDNIQLDLQGLTPSSVPALETKPTLPLPLPSKVVWEGVLDMSTMSEMPSAGYLKKKCTTRALYVSGPDMKDVSIEQSLTVKGKISVPKLFGYLAQIEASPSRAVTVAAVEPIGDDNELVYKTAYTYFIDQVYSPSFPSPFPLPSNLLKSFKQRAAVFSVRPGTGQIPSLEEVYVTPVPENIPHDFPSLLRPPFRGSVSINGKLLAVFIIRTAPASTPYGKSSPRRAEKKGHRHSPASSNGAHIHHFLFFFFCLLRGLFYYICSRKGLNFILDCV
jgi:hypothetical protein